jgi:asparagine synthase (glutamine-hydrolysing)
MRTPLRAWIEDTLLSKRAMERGYFEPDYVRGLIKEQISGGNRAGKLGGLLTLELWHRQFVD